jgi:glutaconate CoA-transferase subunit B
VLDFGGPSHTMRLRSVHPGVTVAQVQEQTCFELALADPVGETPAPSAEQLDIIRRLLDPHNMRASVFKH